LKAFTFTRSQERVAREYFPTEVCMADLRTQARDHVIRIDAHVRVQMRHWIRRNVADVDPRKMGQDSLAQVLEDNGVNVVDFVEKAKAEMVSVITSEGYYV